MRISDWSSDVCSSDLAGAPAGLPARAPSMRSGGRVVVTTSVRWSIPSRANASEASRAGQSSTGAHQISCARSAAIDRKSVVKGKSVSVRVDLGGRSNIKKKKKSKKTEQKKRQN